MGRSASRIAYKNLQNALNYEENVKIKVENEFLTNRKKSYFSMKRSDLRLAYKKRIEMMNSPMSRSRSDSQKG